VALFLNEASSRASQQAGSMSEEASTSGRAQPLTCSSDITKYAFHVACVYIHGIEMRLSGPNFLQLGIHYKTDSCFNSASFCEDISTSLQSTKLSICFIGQLLIVGR